MSIPRELQQREAEADGGGMLKAVVQGIVAVCRGWRAPPRHEHDEADAAEASADAKVTAAIHKGVAQMKGDDDGTA